MRKLYTTTVLLAFITLGGYAQNRIGGVRILPIQLEERIDSLFLEMDIHVDGTSLNRCQSWTILPYLVTPDSTYVLQMPRALVNGTRKAKIFRRQLKYRNEYLLGHYPEYQVDKRHRRDTTFTYTFRAPYELWMDSASLNIRQILTSCAERDQWFVLENLERVRLMPYVPCQLSPILNYVTPEREVKTLSLSGSAYLDFEVGKSVIRPNFRRNPQELAKIHQVMNQVQGNPDFTISGIQVTGYASPEGSWASNDRLSLNRSLALKKYIQDQFSVEQGMIAVSNVPEDWEGLVEMVTQSNISSKESVLEMISQIADPDVREARIKVMDGGRPYRTMLTQMYPSLRRVEYRVDFNVKEYSLEEVGPIMEKNPGQLNQYELFILAQSFPENSPERRQAIETTIRMFPTHPVANINAMVNAMHEGDLYRAGFHSAAAARTPDTYNIWGVYYTMTEQMDKAQEYFDMALEAAGPQVGYSQEEIRHNMAEMERKREDIRVRQRYEMVSQN